MKKYFFVKPKFLIGVIFVLLTVFFNKESGLIYGMDNKNLFYIMNENDLIELETKCFDSDWSNNKKVILQSDIDLSKSKFKCIRIFNGEFDGQNYKISGLKYSGNASDFAFFCYLEKNARVKNLELEVNFDINGTQKNIAGLAAKNFGLIKDCVFNGRIKAKECVGGIAGINYESGKILNCRANGEISGLQCIGGICGKNSGEISSCENNCLVNNEVIEPKRKIGDIDLKKITSSKNFIDIMDVGGIAGFSDGVLKDCLNNVKVGCQHVGYNIGGICGRQRNYINNCINTGKVYGRKDIGGICGQAEPHRNLEYGESMLDRISIELDKLSDLFKVLMTNSKNVRRDSLNKISGLRDYMHDLNKYVKKITDDSQQYLNNSVEKINSEMEKISSSLNNVVPVLKNINKNIGNINLIIGEYKNALDCFNKAYEEIDMDNCLDGIDKFSSAFKTMSEDMNKILDLTEDIKDNLDSGNDFKESCKNLKGNIKDFGRICENLIELCDELKDMFAGIISKIKYTELNHKNDLALVFSGFINLFETAKINFVDLRSGAQSFAYSMDILKNGLENVDVDEIKNNCNEIKDSMREINNSFLKISNGLDNFYKTMQELDIAAGYIKDGCELVKKTTDKLRAEIGSMIKNFDLVIDEMEIFLSKPVLKLDKVSDEFLNDKDIVLDRLNRVSDIILDVSDNLNQKQDVINNNLNDVFEQAINVFDSFKEKVEKQKNKSWKLKDYFKDISDIENNNFIDGKIDSCVNKGFITGDLNVGGIVGNMSIEYDFDPEDDIEENNERSLDVIYRAKAIIKDCKNYGKIEAKKNYVGGIVGKSEIGAVNNSFSTGVIKSDDGSYVGGIAGYSGFLIKNSCSKVLLSGKDYIGGIVGFGNKIFDCNSLVFFGQKDDINKEVDFRVCDQEFIGAIAGNIDDDGECKNCFFVGENFGGINDINYKNQAEKIDYQGFISLRNLFADMKYFNIYFFDQGNLIKDVNINYNENLNEILIPDIVSSENSFGYWNIKSFNNINHNFYVDVNYENYITAIESELKRDNGLPIFIAEGKFDFDSKINASELEKDNKYELEKFEIEIKNNLSDKTRVHYLIPGKYKKNKNVKLKVFENENWHEKKFDFDGSYLVFEIDESTEKIMIEQKTFLW